MQNDNNNGAAVGWAGTIAAFAADALRRLEWLSGVAADLLPILGVLSALISMGYMMWKWRRESRSNKQQDLQQ